MSLPGKEYRTLNCLKYKQKLTFIEIPDQLDNLSIIPRTETSSALEVKQIILTQSALKVF